jgi:arylsulfatase A-like enzyme
MRLALASLTCVALAASLGIGWLGCARTDAPGDRPNILLITVDTLRADFLSSYGFPAKTSPNIDALAAQGVVFDRAIATSSATAPSHASIMTSRYTRQHSISYRNGDTTLQGAKTLAEVLREAGYVTAAFVSNVVLDRRTGLDLGFDVYDDELPSPELNRPFIFERIAEETTARALGWLEAMESGPFFLWVHYQDPHGPYAPPEAYRGRFRLPHTPEEKALPLLENDSGNDGIPTYQVLPGLSLPSEYMSRYADEIFYADHSIGELLQSVDSHRSGRDVIVLLTSDHGEIMGENDLYFVHYKATTPPEAHVPMILRAPGLPAERRSDAVSLVDVMPTLLELAGLEPPLPMSGLALGPLLRKQRPIPERTLYCDIGTEASAYRGDGFIRVTKNAADDLVWVSYTWGADGTWTSQGTAIAETEPLQEYLQWVTPMAKAPPLEPEEIERLRALGYVGN